MTEETTNTTNDTTGVGTKTVTTAPTTDAPKVEKYDGAWVKATRERLKLTQQEFCAKVGVTQGLVSQVEKGHTPVSKKFKAKIEAVLKAN